MQAERFNSFLKFVSLNHEYRSVRVSDSLCQQYINVNSQYPTKLYFIELSQYEKIKVGSNKFILLRCYGSGRNTDLLDRRGITVLYDTLGNQLDFFVDPHKAMCWEVI
jgi:hypothetical protein